jgi:hypothetical protein
MHKFLRFILKTKLYIFRTVPLSIIRSYSLYTQRLYVSYGFVDSFRAGSGWNVLILLENFQNKFEKLVHLVGFIIRKFVTMHGHVNVKKKRNMFYTLLVSTEGYGKVFCFTLQGRSLVSRMLSLTPSNLRLTCNKTGIVRTT